MFTVSPQQAGHAHTHVADILNHQKKNISFINSPRYFSPETSSKTIKNSFAQKHICKRNQKMNLMKIISFICVCACMLSRFSHVQLFATLWTIACQAPIDYSPAKNTGVGFHFLLQGSFPTRDRTRIFYVSCIGGQVLYY